MSTEQYRIGAKNLHSRLQIIFVFQCGKIRCGDDESESRMSPNVVSILTNPLWIHVLAQGHLLRRHNRKFENLPEDIRVSEAGEDAV